MTLITRPAPDYTGIVRGLTIDAYHGDQSAISKSGLDRIARSPAHFYGLTLDPDRPGAEEDEKETAAHLNGNLLHCAFLEPDQFGSRYITLPDDAPRKPTEAQWNAKNPNESSRAAQAWWMDFNASKGNKQEISAKLYSRAWRQADSLRKIRELRDAVSKGHPEVSAYWTDPTTGVRCRCRPDFVHDWSDSAVMLIDAKTCGQADAFGFARQVAQMRYHVQDAMYSDGYAAATGKKVLGFIFAAVEMEWPYVASASMLNDISKAQGRKEYRRDLLTYKECRDTAKWPGYSDGVMDLSLPAWAIEE